MLDPAISQFLNERRLLWLNKKVKGSVNPMEQHALEQQSIDAYTLKNWLPTAALRANQLTAATHPAKFSHPDAKINPIIAKPEKTADGLLRSGNVDVEPDVFGNAAALDVYKFLNLKLADGQTVQSHLEQHTAEIVTQFDLADDVFQDIRQSLLGIQNKASSAKKTSTRIKQVFFPVNPRHYHLLSVLTPSNLMFKLKERINEVRFSIHAKIGREAKKANFFFDGEFAEIDNLSLIGFGGTKPQNISVLNNENGGTAYLLPSLPPLAHSRPIEPPKISFFNSSLDAHHFRKRFEHWHQQMVRFQADGDIHTRKKCDESIQAIIHLVADTLWQIRGLHAGWSNSEHYQHLPEFEKIWLDAFYADTRETAPNSYWITVKNRIVIWFVNSYIRLLDDRALKLGKREILRINTIVTRCTEALR